MSCVDDAGTQASAARSRQSVVHQVRRTVVRNWRLRRAELAGLGERCLRPHRRLRRDSVRLVIVVVVVAVVVSFGEGGSKKYISTWLGQKAHAELAQFTT
jgi:hypothetical protein